MHDALSILGQSTGSEGDEGVFAVMLLRLGHGNFRLQHLARIREELCQLSLRRFQVDVAHPHLPLPLLFLFLPPLLLLRPHPLDHYQLLSDLPDPQPLVSHLVRLSKPSSSWTYHNLMMEARRGLQANKPHVTFLLVRRRTMTTQGKTSKKQTQSENTTAKA
jgi:hypothetical protein